MIWRKNTETNKTPSTLKSHLRSFSFPLRELSVWLLFSLTAMTLAMPLCLWMNRSSDEDFIRLIKTIRSSKSLKFVAVTDFHPIAALPTLPMDLPVKFTSASNDEARAMTALSPSINLLGKMVESTSPPPLFHKSMKKYERLITETARKYDVSPLLVKAIIQAESNFNPQAVSNRGAVGLMQVMPSTARAMGISEPMDPEKNITAGVRYLKNLLVLFDDDERLAIAAYNCGPEAMKRWSNSPPYAETKNFVRRVMSYYNFYLS